MVLEVISRIAEDEALRMLAANNTEDESKVGDDYKIKATG